MVVDDGGGDDDNDGGVQLVVFPMTPCYLHLQLGLSYHQQTQRAHYCC